MFMKKFVGILLPLGMLYGCAAAMNDSQDAIEKLETLGYRRVTVRDEDAVFAEEYCGNGYGTSFEFEGHRIGEETVTTIGRLCVPEVGEIFTKPKVIVESRVSDD